MGENPHVYCWEFLMGGEMVRFTVLYYNNLYIGEECMKNRRDIKRYKSSGEE